MKKSISIYLTLFFISSLCLFSCTGNSSEESVYLQDSEAIAHGEELFSRHCASCHNFDQALIGPNLSGVTTDAEHDWLKNFIRNAPEMIEQGDPRAKQLYEQYKQYMPPFTMLEEQEVESILAYMHTHQEESGTASNEADPADALEDPIPEKIPDSGLRLVMEKVLQIPASAEEPSLARVNRLRTIRQNGKERLFINDLRGNLYEIRDNKASVFMNMKEKMPNFMDNPGWGTGLAHYEFHPEFNENGLFYTTHTEKPGSAPADFAYDDSIKVTVQYVLTEWKMDNAQAMVFSGSKRELMRANMVTQIHGMQGINFNPAARPGDADYGLLYIGLGDGGAAFGGYPFLTRDKGKVWGSVLRIDPSGNDSKNGNYGIPKDNPWANEEGALGEVWCHGFRNPHHFSWDTSGKTLYVTDIGQHQIEEINIAKPGGDYGWPEREGTFMISTEGDANHIYPLPEDDPEAFIYPVAQYDHDEGNAIMGGGVYQGSKMPQMKGKYLFGDIVNGRVFFTDSEEMQPGQQAPIQSLSLRLEGASESTDFQQLSGEKRVALRTGVDSQGEFYFFTQSDGMLYRVTGCESTGDVALSE